MRGACEGSPMPSLWQRRACVQFWSWRAPKRRRPLRIPGGEREVRTGRKVRATQGNTRANALLQLIDPLGLGPLALLDEVRSRSIGDVHQPTRG